MNECQPKWWKFILCVLLLNITFETANSSSGNTCSCVKCIRQCRLFYECLPSLGSRTMRDLREINAACHTTSTEIVYNTEIVYLNVFTVGLIHPKIAFLCSSCFHYSYTETLFHITCNRVESLFLIWLRTIHANPFGGVQCQ